MAFRSALRRLMISTSIVHASSPRPTGTTFAPLISSRLLSCTSFHAVDSNEDHCTINALGGSFTRSDTFPIQRGITDQYMENPFQISGPRGAYEAKRVEEGLFLRMDMPGIDKEDVKVWVEYGNVCVKGEGKKESKQEDMGRTYSASVEICSNSYQPQKIIAEMNNGVLRMLIPKTKSFHEITGSFEIEVK